MVEDDLGEGRRLVEVLHPAGTDLLDVLGRHGEVPLPPYITEPLRDAERYQTTYADQPGSVAAPTAGLHLTAGGARPDPGRGAIEVRDVELVVGLGTFRPDRHRPGRGPPDARRALPRRRRARSPPATAAERVVAVGTTTVRALESAAATGRLEGRTELFIHGDRPFAVVDALMTNFHQPRSSLLVLVEAFVGPRWRDLYATALAEGYRFLSFGDAMLLPGERG